MADDKNIRVTVTDDTESGLNSVARSFATTTSDLKRQFAADQKKMGETQIPIKSLMDYANKTNQTYDTVIQKYVKGANAQSAAAKGVGQAMAAAGQVGTAATTSLIGGLAAAAVQAGLVGVALETVKQGFLGWAEFDKKLRAVQNSTGMTRSGVEGLAEEMRNLGHAAGVTKEEMLSGFIELKEAAGLSVEQTKRIYSDSVLAAKGANADIKTWMRAQGDIMRNFKIPAEQSKIVWEAMSHAAGEFNLNINEVGPSLSRLTQMMSAWGYTGVDGAQRMVTMLGAVKEATGDASSAASALTRIIAGMGSKEMADALGFRDMEAFEDDLRSSEDSLGRMIHLMATARDQRRVWQAVGIRDKAVMDKLREMLVSGEFMRRLDQTRDASGALMKGLNSVEGPAASIERLTNSLTDLRDAIGYLLDTAGLSAFFSGVADDIQNIARGAYRLISLLKWALPGGERPEWLKSFGEHWYNLNAPKDAMGKNLMTYQHLKAGGDPRQAKEDYDKGLEVERGKLRKKQEEQRYKDEMDEYNRLKKIDGLKPILPTRPESMGPDTGGPQGGPRWQQIPQAQKFGAVVEDATKKLVAFTEAMPDQAHAAEIRGGLVHLASYSGGESIARGVVAAGGSTTGAGGAAFAGQGWSGGAPQQYGGSLDARYLKASYSPGGDGGYGGGGGAAAPYTGSPGSYSAGPPGRGGTGYGGGDAPAPGGPRAPGDSTPPGEGGGGLAADRAKFKAEMDANPALREKVLRIAANEQGKHGLGTQAVIESMMNRASSRGRTLAQEARWTGEGGYYAQGSMGRGALENPEHAAILNKSLDAALAGGNVSDFATDNASSWLAAKRKGNREMEWTRDYGGESFFRPGRVSGEGNVRSHRDWMARVQRDGGGVPAVAGAPGAAPGEGGSWVKEEQGRVAGIRKGALSPETRAFLEAAGAEHGLRADVYSGGQRMHGAEGATGSHRHDKGGAGDFKLYDPEAKRYLDSRNPADAARMEAYVASAVKAGATGVGHGHGYMGPQSLHIGGGSAASWGGSDWIERARRKGMAMRGPGGAPVLAAKPPGMQMPDQAAWDKARQDAETQAVPTGEARGVNLETRVNLKVNDNEVQFARTSLRRQADREVREARWNSYSDIGAA